MPDSLSHVFPKVFASNRKLKPGIPTTVAILVGSGYTPEQDKP